MAEAILPPGHAALTTGEDGWAMNALGEIDVHGATSSLSKDQIDAYCELKWEDVMRWETSPSPVEFDMYYSY